MEIDVSAQATSYFFFSYTRFSERFPTWVLTHHSIDIVRYPGRIALEDQGRKKLTFWTVYAPPSSSQSLTMLEWPWRELVTSKHFSNLSVVSLWKRENSLHIRDSQRPLSPAFQRSPGEQRGRVKLCWSIPQSVYLTIAVPWEREWVEQVTGSRGADDGVDEKKRKLEVEKKFLPFVLRLTKPWALAWSCDKLFSWSRVQQEEKGSTRELLFTQSREQGEKKRRPGKNLRSSWHFFFLSWMFIYIYTYGVLISL